MKDSIRLFVAAVLPEALKTQLQDQLQAFRHPAIRFVPAQNLHLTLYFIGNVPVEQRSMIQKTLREVASRYTPFTLTYVCTEPGPNHRHPRLIWAKFDESDEFSAISHDLSLALAPNPPKNRKAIPHVTLARFRKDLPAPTDLTILPAKDTLQLHVPALALWHSELASPHPVYTVLETFALG